MIRERTQDTLNRVGGTVSTLMCDAVEGYILSHQMILRPASRYHEVMVPAAAHSKVI